MLVQRQAHDTLYTVRRRKKELLAHLTLPHHGTLDFLMAG